MCEIELGLTVTGSLIQLDIVCYLGARLSLTSDYECKVILGLYSARFSLAFKLGFETYYGARRPLTYPVYVELESQGLQLSVSVVAEIRVQETNTRLVTLSHVDLPKRISDVGRSELVIEEVWFADYFDHRELSFATIPLSVELGLEYARRVGEIRLGGELEEPEAELGEDDVRSSEVERFVPPSVIADLMRISMDWILATVRESLASMADWVVSWWGTGDLCCGDTFLGKLANFFPLSFERFGHAILPIVVAPMSLVLQRFLCFAPCRQDFFSGRNCRIDELTVESRNSRVDGFQIDERLTSRNGWINEKKCQIDEISVASRKIAGAELTIARTDIVVFYSVCSSVDVRPVVTVQRIFTGVLVDGPNNDRSRPIASVHRSFHEKSYWGGTVLSSLSCRPARAAEDWSCSI
ncbi:hypothetical protein AT1G47657 [Arabidopsis thaliana]|uniref:Uncharacterized protein n=1 Tax=Arabidopsis thaliana TaxID=3702 RepID=A0A1P8AN40_ARATH|nr:uncharacterized protein AT1G47657 [Arabidopsis thaliana]ANM58065.1 hypothetical protein AT1G47657 [Arabidopsis thaliana]|eukprot:NP_001320529.1 hypothetical protein AT1G47657 [Arabidopsis thaliana]